MHDTSDIDMISVISVIRGDAEALEEVCICVVEEEV